MASSLEERERAFENKFAHDQELKFKAEARRNRLVAIWASGYLGKTGEETEEYVREVIRADLAEGSHHDLFKKLRSDLDAAGASVSDEELRRTIVEMTAEAVTQIQNT